jgi:hypothetical protein
VTATSPAPTFSWLAYSEREQREAQDLASTLSERETRDELGIGAIRDALADRLFPGTSTIQSRARYFLFLPWLFQLLEREPSGRSRERADRLERQLAAVLRESADTAGLVGAQTLAVQRLPSSIYWNGLGILRIRRYALSLSDYYRWLDDPQRTTRVLVDDDGLPLAGEARTIWEPLPEAPGSFPDQAEFRLRPVDSQFLQDRVRAASPYRTTLLQLLFDHGRPDARCDFPWTYPWRRGRGATIPAEVREELEVAELFSLGYHGAALLFNLLIAEAREETDQADRYRRRIAAWQDRDAPRVATFRLERLWSIVPPTRVSTATRDFVTKWFALVPGSMKRPIADVSEARELVRRRELRVKGGQRSRIANPFRVGWNGASGSARLDYRWGAAVQQIVLDVVQGRSDA